MIMRDARFNRFTAFFVVLAPAAGALGAGCTVGADPTGAHGEVTGSVPQADTFTPAPPGDPRLDSLCDGGASQVIHNTDWPFHEAGPCPAGRRVHLRRRRRRLRGSVKYFGYSCADLGDGQHTWTVYSGCCAPRLQLRPALRFVRRLVLRLLGHRLHPLCLCQDAFGHLVDTSINTSCGVPISNCNGTLTCGPC